MHIVKRDQLNGRSINFISQQLGDVGPRVVLACVTRTAFTQRTKIFSVALSAHFYQSLLAEGLAKTSGPRGKDAIKHVGTEERCYHEVFCVTDSHNVAWLVCGK